MNSNPIPPTVSPQQQEEQSAWQAYKRRLYLAVGVAAFLLVFAGFVSATLNILLLLFLSLLIALGLRGLTDWLTTYTPLGQKLALTIVVIGISAAIVALAVTVGAQLATQFSQLGQAISEAIQGIEQQLRNYVWGQQLLAQVPSVSEIGQQLFRGSANPLAQITGIFSSTLGFLSSVVVMLFMALYFAVEPDTYVKGFLYLIPSQKRDRVHEMLRESGAMLRKWLVTRVISMAAVGIMTGIGLAVIGIPLALSLSILATIGAFIPTFGPIFALIPAALVALSQGPPQMLIVVLLYTGIQAADNYVVTPIMDKSMLYLPPAYVLAAQLLIGVISGPLGLVLAAPIAVALIVIVRKLYIEDVLGEQVSSQQ